jgi:DNA polymerase-3 subunit delta'
MSLRNIVGQGKAVEILLGILENQRIATSYLFCGEPGIGKKTAAVQFAKALNCKRAGAITEGPDNDPETQAVGVDACDACDACRKIDGGVHPDFLLISPEERQIRIEEIRLIEDALSFKPFEGRKKVVVVDGAEMMNLPAANAFLKTLEEPPEESVLVLVSAKPDLLLSTISSRCSRINFSPLSTEACRAALEAEVPGKDLELVTRLSMGRPGIAFSVDLLDERAWFLELLKGMLNAEKDGWTSREDMERWFEYAMVLLRDMAVLKVTGDISRLINVDLGDYLDGLNKSLDLKVIINVHKELNQLKELLIFNLNKSITWNYTASLLRKEIVI